MQAVHDMHSAVARDVQHRQHLVFFEQGLGTIDQFHFLNAGVVAFSNVLFQLSDSVTLTVNWHSDG